ncbi:hypothetical protein [Nocardiopsis synnemataformans]|uniref:hypothetical protein n=1 Tax=Nocardiopsis synnemataformans TaxID=61305 RepID=UPI003EBA9019
MRSLTSMFAVLLLALTACSQPILDDTVTEADTVVPSPSPVPETTHEFVEQRREGDAWYEALTDEQRDLIHDSSAGLCSVADEEITYGEVNGDQQSMTYTRDLVIELGYSVGIAVAGEGDQAARSARQFLMAYVSEVCPEHIDAVAVVLDEQYDAVFGTALNDRAHTL